MLHPGAASLVVGGYVAATPFALRLPVRRVLALAPLGAASVAVLTRGLPSDLASLAALAAAVALLWRVWLRDVPAGRVALAAVAVLAATVPAPTGTRSALAADPGPVVVAKRHVHGTTRVLFLGDAVAHSLASGLRDANGVEVVDGTFPGDLPEGWPVTWAGDVRASDPDVVAVLVARWDATFVDQVVTVLAGRRVVLLTAPTGNAPVSAGVPVVDLAGALAPEGVETTTINGVVVRDGAMLTPAGARLVQSWLYRQLSRR